MQKLTLARDFRVLFASAPDEMKSNSDPPLLSSGTELNARAGLSRCFYLALASVLDLFFPISGNLFGPTSFYLCIERPTKSSSLLFVCHNFSFRLTFSTFLTLSSFSTTQSFWHCAGAQIVAIVLGGGTMVTQSRAPQMPSSYP